MTAKLRKDDEKPTPPKPEGCSCSWEYRSTAKRDEYIVNTHPDCKLHGWKRKEG